MDSFNITNFSDIEDMAPGFGLGDVQEARFATKALGCDQLGISRVDMKPRARAPFAHKHGEQEELYVIVSGSGSVALDDDVRPVREGDIVRVDPEITRSFDAGDDGLSYLAFGAPAVSGGSNDAEIIELETHAPAGN